MNWLKKHTLSLVLGIILIAQGIGFWILGRSLWISEQKAHGEPINNSDFLVFFWAEMLVSILADTYGAILLVLLTKKLREKGSKESK